MIKRYNNKFVYWCGTRWQERAHVSRDLCHKDKRCMCHKGIQSQAGMNVVPDGRFKLTRARSCTTGTWWCYDEDRDRADLRSCDLRPLGRHVRTSGNRASELATSGLLVGATGPLDMLPPETISSHLGMGHTGAAGSGEVRSWRDVVRTGAGVILNDLGSQHPGYIPNWVERATLPPLAGAIRGWAMTP